MQIWNFVNVSSSFFGLALVGNVKKKPGRKLKRISLVFVNLKFEMSRLFRKFQQFNQNEHKKIARKTDANELASRLRSIAFDVILI